ncbi:hypothetical protein [Ligilactobacillus ruminis]|jgi:hypothetical protein|uniref:hypothetical protein n=1 Tax=Ligilactobacillus ruminis TaxID=1623 RepID=UPI00232DA4B8|nr:hypothetical protein [Ligilactobacillus ruminis]MDB7638173.1 hypothetical protein [Ligilactobacillus ruminis]MDB7680643.1 hypothetical protein [Ligilactobacillus ruminis]
MLTIAENIEISLGLFGHSSDEEVRNGMDEGILSKNKGMFDDMHNRKHTYTDDVCFICPLTQNLKLICTVLLMEKMQNEWKVLFD